MYLASSQRILSVLRHSVSFVQNHQLEARPSDTHCTYYTLSSHGLIKTITSDITELSNRHAYNLLRQLNRTP